MSAGRVPGGIDSYCCDAPDFDCSVAPRSAIEAVRFRVHRLHAACLPGGCSGRPSRAWTAADLVFLLLIRRCASPCVQPAPGLLRLRALTTGDRRACLQPRPPSVERAAGLTPPCEAALVERPAVATFHLRERTPLLRGGSSGAHQRGRQRPIRNGWSDLLRRTAGEVPHRRRARAEAPIGCRSRVVLTA